MKRLYFFTAILMIFCVCNNAGRDETTTTDSLEMNDTSQMMNDTASMAMVNHAEAEILATKADTTVNGKITFDSGSNSEVNMKLDLTIPSRAGKSVAVHIHESGDCGNAGDMSKGHWNPTNAQHGKWGSGSYHLGDIGNVKLDKDGKGVLALTTDQWALGGSSDKNIIGKAIIVHSGVDDYKSQPSGDAGSRIGCGVIK